MKQTTEPLTLKPTCGVVLLLYVRAYLKVKAEASAPAAEGGEGEGGVKGKTRRVASAAELKEG